MLRIAFFVPRAQEHIDRRRQPDAQHDRGVVRIAGCPLESVAPDDFARIDEVLVETPQAKQHRGEGDGLDRGLGFTRTLEPPR